ESSEHLFAQSSRIALAVLRRLEEPPRQPLPHALVRIQGGRQVVEDSKHDRNGVRIEYADGQLPHVRISVAPCPSSASARRAVCGPCQSSLVSAELEDLLKQYSKSRADVYCHAFSYTMQLLMDYSHLAWKPSNSSILSSTHNKLPPQRPHSTTMEPFTPLTLNE